MGETSAEQDVEAAYDSDVEAVDLDTSLGATGLGAAGVADGEYNPYRTGDEEADRAMAETMAAILKEDTDDDHFNRSFDGLLDDRSRYLDHTNANSMQDDTAEAREKREEKTKRKLDRLNATVDKKLTPYEELYEMNPDAFANMQASDFMTVAKEFSGTSVTLEYLSSYLGKQQRFEEEMKKMSENEELANPDFVRAHLNNISNALGMDDTTDRELHKEFGRVNKDWFDMTPRQIMEGYQNLIEKYSGEIAAKKEEAEKKRTEILDRYKPEDRPNEEIGEVHIG